jgi:molecular chaperone Hsp33
MIKKDIFKQDVKARFKAAAKDRVHRFVMADNKIKGAMVHATLMVNEMRASHELGPVETLILGQAYIAGALLSTTLKGEDRISLSIECSGPIKGLDVEANGYGEVRGFLKTPEIVASDSAHTQSLSALFGAGFLTVTKYLEDARHPYSSRVHLAHGTIAQDLAAYFLESEQIPPGQTLARGKSVENVVMETFAPLSPRLLDQTRVSFFCRCSRDRMQGYLKNLSPDVRTDILENGPFPLEIRCHYCHSVYHFTQKALSRVLG